MPRGTLASGDETHATITHMHRLSRREIATLKQQSEQSKRRAVAACNPYAVDMRVQGDASDKSGRAIPSIAQAAATMNVYQNLTENVGHLDADFTKVMNCYNALCATAVPQGQEARVHSSIAGDELCNELIDTGTKITQMRSRVKQMTSEVSKLQNALLASIPSPQYSPGIIGHI